MKKTKIIPFLLIVMIAVCFCPRQVMAAEGNIRVELPKGIETTVYYGIEGEKEQEIKTNGESSVVIPNLKEGTYQIRIQNMENYTFSESKVTVPMWSEEEHKMLYDIIIEPKYSFTALSPQTGDSNRGMICVGAVLISFIIVAIISCHNHLKCGRMFDKYSK